MKMMWLTALMPEGVGAGVGVGTGVGVGFGLGVGVGVGVGVGDGVGVGVGVGDGTVAVKVSVVAKLNPVEFHARITMVCLPAGMESAAVKCALVLLALLTESRYSFMPVMGCVVSRAPALNCTGDATVAPLAGAQIFTVWLTVELQVCDHAAGALNIGTRMIETARRKRAPRRTVRFVKQTARLDDSMDTLLPRQEFIEKLTTNYRKGTLDERCGLLALYSI
jgi:hypothetical protein